MAHSRVQIGLWLTPTAGFSVADAHAIKVRVSHCLPEPDYDRSKFGPVDNCPKDNI